MNNQHSKPNKLLAIDTSTAVLTVALLQTGEVISQAQVSAERNHSIQLVPTIKQLVSELGWSMADLSGIAVGQGPGSYTGVRIGVTVAKTMAWTLGVPLAGVSSLEALAYSGWQAVSEAEKPVNEWFIPLMDARRGKVYTALYEWKSGMPEAAVHHPSDASFSWDVSKEDGIRLLTGWLQELNGALTVLSPELLPERITFVGEVDPIADQLKAGWLEEQLLQRVQIRICSLSVRAESVGLLALRRWHANEVQDVHDFIPNYTQLAEAEAKLMAKQKSGQGVND